MSEMHQFGGQLELVDTRDEEGRIRPARAADAQMRGTEAVMRLTEQEATRPREVKEANMAAEFLSQAKEALRQLQRAQQQRERHERLARERYHAARAEYHRAVARAVVLEGMAWVRLLEVPGMSVRTAATLGGVSVATVHRRLKEARDV